MNVHARELADSFDLRAADGQFYADPYPTYARCARRTRQARQRQLVPDRYADLVTAYKSSKRSAPTRRWSLPRSTALAALRTSHDQPRLQRPPAHTRVRRLIMGALSPRAIAAMEGDLIALVDMLLDTHRRQTRSS